MVTATGDPAVDQQVFDDAEAAGIWVNSADDPDRCTFTLPAVVRRDPVVVAVATGGHSPALATWLRRRLADELGPEVAVLAGLLGAARSQVKAAGRSTEDLDWQALLDGGLLDVLVADGEDGRPGPHRRLARTVLGVLACRTWRNPPRSAGQFDRGVRGGGRRRRRGPSSPVDGPRAGEGHDAAAEAGAGEAGAVHARGGGQLGHERSRAGVDTSKSSRRLAWLADHEPRPAVDEVAGGQGGGGRRTRSFSVTTWRARRRTTGSSMASRCVERGRPQRARPPPRPPRTGAARSA